MPTAKLVPAGSSKSSGSERGLPEILKTPGGTALVEIQGTVFVGTEPLVPEDESEHIYGEVVTDIGELDLAKAVSVGGDVSLIVGARQRLRGKVVKLSKPLAVLEMPLDTNCSEIPVREIITHKLTFSDRPEPYMPDQS